MIGEYVVQLRRMDWTKAVASQYIRDYVLAHEILRLFGMTKIQGDERV